MVLSFELKKIASVLGKIIIMLLIAAVAAILTIKFFYPMEYDEIIEKNAAKYGLEPSLVYAVINTESGFDEKAISARGASGLMQIMKPTAKWAAEKIPLEEYREERICEPEINIEIGCWYLRYLIKKYDNNMTLVIAAYNAGEGNVNKWLYDTNYSENGKRLDNIPFKETEEYVERVNTNKRVYEKLLKLRREK